MMENATAIFCDSDTAASLPGCKSTDGHDAVLAGALLGWLGSAEPWRGREVDG